MNNLIPLSGLLGGGKSTLAESLAATTLLC